MMDKTALFDNLLAPRQNHTLKGQTDAEQVFFDHAKSGNLHHAWLLCGPKGIGKATLAYRIARYMLSKKSNDISSPILTLDLDATLTNEEESSFENSPLYLDPEHPISRRVANGSHSDLLTIECSIDETSKKLSKEISVDDVRSIGPFLHKTAAEAVWRVVIIDAVDEMTISAANALLKVLEEPPNRVLLLLVSHNPSSLLATIRSRCRQLVLKPLDTQNFKSIIETQTTSIDSDELDYLLTICSGSVGLAMQLIESDGSEILRLTDSILSNLLTLDIQSLDTLCEYFNKQSQNNSFWVLRLILNHWLSEKVKHKAIYGCSSDREVHRWIDTWEQMNNLFHKAESVNLGRKQVILNTFFAIATVARSYSTDANQNNYS